MLMCWCNIESATGLALWLWHSRLHRAEKVMGKHTAKSSTMNTNTHTHTHTHTNSLSLSASHTHTHTHTHTHSCMYAHTHTPRGTRAHTHEPKKHPQERGNPGLYKADF